MPRKATLSPLGPREFWLVVSLCAVYVAGFVLPSFGLLPNFAKASLGANALAVGAAIKFLPVLILGLSLLQQANRVDKSRVARSFALCVGVGLVFGSLGDLLLDFADVYPLTFLLGLASFLVGHVFYCLAFAWYHGQHSSSKKRLHINPLVIAVFVAVPATLLKILWPHLPSDMVVPVVIYGVTLALMGFLSVARNPALVSKRNYLFGVVGSVVFILSDSILAINKFRSELPYGKLAVMLTYYSAQILMAKCAAQALMEDGSSSSTVAAAARVPASAKKSSAAAAEPSSAKKRTASKSPAPNSAKRRVASASPAARRASAKKTTTKQ